jgi:hypothetical protein
MSGAQREAGFALPIAIFIVTLVTIMLAAIFVRVEADRRIAESSGSSVDALAIAHSGLQRYFAHYDSLGTRPPDGDSLRLNVSGGYADVIARFVQRPADTSANQTYIVRSTGRVIEPTQGADPQAVRTVAQFAQWQTGTIDVLASFTAANRFDAPGPPGTEGTLDIRGVDQCGLMAPAAGVRVPDPPPWYPPGVTGSPAWEDWGTAVGVATQTDIDWAAVTGGDFVPDYTSLVNLDTWSSYLITGDAILNTASGSGLLVVTGNLEFGGAGSAWRGVILVGGEIDFDGTLNDIRGAMVSGLNYLTGPVPPGGVWGPNGTLTRIWYQSCFVDSALTAISGFAPIPNAWVDNWATY